jgi:N-acetylglucosamine-6-phosphate deacetylase
MPDRKSFAGSVATADRLVRTMIQMAGVSITDAIRMMSMTPASIMKISDRKGSIKPGKDADIVLFDEDIRIHTTMIKGKIVYQVSE